MSGQAVGAKKLAQARRETGLDLERVLRVSNTEWLGRVRTLPLHGHGHAHVRINPVTWEWKPDSMHWSSCGDADA